MRFKSEYVTSFFRKDRWSSVSLGDGRGPTKISELAAMDWTESQIVAGKLPAELNDLPYRNAPHA